MQASVRVEQCAENPKLAPLFHASFRPRLATAPLRFANPPPPSGWVEDFHPQAVEHARHTKKAPRHGEGPSRACVRSGKVRT